MKKVILIGIIILMSFSSKAQHTDSTARRIKELCSHEMQGRGYVLSGDRLAALYIEHFYKSRYLESFDSVEVEANDKKFFKKIYMQKFNMDVNTFPKEIYLKFGKNNEMVAGKDFIVAPNSRGIKKLTDFVIEVLEPSMIKNEKIYEEYYNKDFTNVCVVIDEKKFTKFKYPELLQNVKENQMKASAIMFLEDKLTWGVSTSLGNYPIIRLKRIKFPVNEKFMTAKIDNQFITNYPTQNVIGYIKGTKNNDKYIAITAHYDHLGKMGENSYFVGANDNASGVAMMLDLIDYYKANPPAYNIVFMAFAGEEAGLLGSKFYVENPKFPLNKIEFLLNLDLMGTGQDGLMIVNGKDNPKFALLTKINQKMKYLPVIKSRANAPNSDHYFFSKNGVNSFFFYLLGEYPYYHDINDKPRPELSLRGYNGTFKLINNFIKEIDGRGMSESDHVQAGEDGNLLFDKVGSDIDKMPEFRGGEKKLKEYIKKNLVYPKKDFKEGISGVSVVYFVVSAKGEITNIELKKSISKAIDKEALRLVTEMPKWSPAKNEGRSISYPYTLKIPFNSTNNAIAKEQEPEYPTTADKMPIFKFGGTKIKEQDEKIKAYFAQNMKYPKSEKKAGKEGTVQVSFVIDRTGAVTEIRVIKSLSKAFDKEAVRLISEMPRWIAGKTKGRSVAVQMNLDVVFEISE